MRKALKLIVFIFLATYVSTQVVSAQQQKPKNRMDLRKPGQKKPTAKKVAPGKQRPQAGRPATAKPRTNRATLPPQRRDRAYATNQYAKQLNQGLTAVKNGQYAQGANILFNLSKRPEMSPYRAQIKYILGTALMELKLYQVAAFQFVDVIRLNSDKYKKQAIEKLSIAADLLGDDTLLNYSISKVQVSEIPASNRDMIFFRIGEVKMKSRDYDDAIRFFAQVNSRSPYYYQALFNRGLSELELNQVDRAISTYSVLLESRKGAGATDTNKVAAQLALARAHYQKKDWEQSIEAYSQIPRDHFMWHDALFEQSWAMLRGARFRSVLSNFQSLHSSYYEDFYIPESLLLRSIVYLYICKYDEMEKVLSLFERTYGPIRERMTNFVRANNDPLAYFAEAESAEKIQKGRLAEEKARLGLPYLVLREILSKGDVKRSFGYLKKLVEEKNKIEGNASFRSSGLGQYSLKIIANRMKNTKTIIGENVKIHLMNMRTELRDLYEQSSMIRYEMIAGKKEFLKKKLSDSSLPENQLDDQINRQFYVQNGFEYYPFQGEYWLDEIGNYHYLGKQSCE